MKLVVGKIYHVNHPRKGHFDIRISDVREKWVFGTITGGYANYLTKENLTIGDDITLRKSVCEFTLILS